MVTQWVRSRSSRRDPRDVVGVQLGIDGLTSFEDRVRATNLAVAIDASQHRGSRISALAAGAVLARQVAYMVPETLVEEPGERSLVGTPRMKLGA